MSGDIMEIFSGIMAWLSLSLFGTMASMLIISLIVRNNEKFDKLKRIIRISYFPTGILLIIASLIHGLTTDQNFFSFNSGAIGFWLIVIFVFSIWASLYMNRWFRIIPYIAMVSILGIAIWHLVDNGGFHLPQNIINAVNNNDDNDTDHDNTGLYVDGTYEGEGDGLKGKIKVNVIIGSGRINAVEITESSDTSAYLMKAKSFIDTQVVSGQNTDNIELATGATFSSKGYLEAINDALSKCKK